MRLRTLGRSSLTTSIDYSLGLASISFKKREKLYSLVEAAMALPGAYSEQGQGVMSEGVKTALLYISNAAKDVKVSEPSELVR